MTGIRRFEGGGLVGDGCRGGRTKYIMEYNKVGQNVIFDALEDPKFLQDNKDQSDG